MTGKTAENGHDAFSNNMAKLAELQQQFIDSYIKKDSEAGISAYYSNLGAILSQIAARALEDPEKLYKQQLELFTGYAKIFGNAWNRYTGENKSPLYDADARDKRFKDEIWNKDLYFDVMKQSYLLTNQWLQNLVHNLDGVDKKTSAKFEFYTRQFTDAMSPSNFAFTNPEVIKETIGSKGENLVRGMQNLIADLESSSQFFNIKTADKNSFKLGKDLAATKGKVIYKNDLMELIQYEPSCKKTFAVPLLLISAWINKYYIFDLSEENSFIKWLRDQGYTVFTISWVNPDKSLAHKKFEDYMLEGPLAALEQIEKATGVKEVTAIGYCLGGTLLAATMAYMKAKKDDRIKAATLLTTMVDFHDVGDMSVFIDEEQLDKMDEQMRKYGFLDSHEIAAIFSMLRANDLIWSFVVNNYLMGRNPMPFDILYWNADATRLPADTHSFYLRNMYLKNLLKKPGALTLAGVPIDVTKVTTPSYILSAKEDHIAPWKTTYATMGLFSGKDNKFVLTGSGHIAGVINHPDRNKYDYSTNSKKAKTPNEWLDGATQHKGSWWGNWHKWNMQYAGEKIAAPKPGRAIGDAPGEYVRG